jgi:hypothetical protein
LKVFLDIFFVFFSNLFFYLSPLSSLSISLLFLFPTDEKENLFDFFDMSTIDENTHSDDRKALLLQDDQTHDHFDYNIDNYGFSFWLKLSHTQITQITYNPSYFFFFQTMITKQTNNFKLKMKRSQSPFPPLTETKTGTSKVRYLKLEFELLLMKVFLFASQTQGRGIDTFLLTSWRVRVCFMMCWMKLEGVLCSYLMVLKGVKCDE